MIRFVGNGESKDPEFQKGYLKLIDKQPTRVMSNAMEKLVSELPRDRHAFQRISDKRLITSLALELFWLLGVPAVQGF